MSGKYALIIGNAEYTDPGLAQLAAPGKDAEDFARVLKDPEIGAFDSVNILLNLPSSSVIEAIDEFFDQKKLDDLLVLYFSGHGVRDELGVLYLAFKNTNRARLRSTAVKSDYIREAMDQSRSKRQVLILDCYNSGTYAQGTKAATGVSIGTATAFEGGYGRIILTANDSTQFAWKGDKVIGETSISLFTHFLVEGLEGEADLDGDGRITVDELYDYAYEQVRLATPKQTPSKFSSKQQGEIILRQSMRMEDIKPIPLPDALLDSIENPFPEVRLGVVQQLVKLLNGKNLGLARSARAALQRISEQDDSRIVSRAASQALEVISQAEELPVEKTEVERKTEEAETQLLAEQKAQEERIKRAKPGAEEVKAKQKSMHSLLDGKNVATDMQPISESQTIQSQIPNVPLESKTMATEGLKPRRFSIWAFAGIGAIVVVAIAVFFVMSMLKTNSTLLTNTPIITTNTTAPTNSPVPPPTSTPLIEVAPEGSFRDDFVGQLAEGWVWMAEDPAKWSLSAVEGSLQIIASDASFDGPNLPSNILLRDPPTGDFEITTSLRFTPTSNFQFAGLVIFQGKGNALQFGRAFCDANVCIGDGIYFDSIEAGSFVGDNFNTAIDGPMVYLRLRRVGNTYTGYYSEDGENWIITGEHARDFSQIRVGLIAAQAPEEIPAVFDYFIITK